MLKTRIRKLLCLALLVIPAIVSASPLWAADEDEYLMDVPVQAMLGATRFSNLKLDYASTKDPTVITGTSFEWMPSIGLAGAVPITRKPMEIGIEGGAVVSLQNDSVRAVGENGTIYITIHNDLVLCDLFIGPSISAIIRDRMKIYGALGPLMMIGWNNIQLDESSSGSVSSSSWDKATSLGVGLYARTGIEFRLNKSSWMGIGVRGFKSQLNFDNVSGKTDIQGIQMLLTYTARI